MFAINPRSPKKRFLGKAWSNENDRTVLIVALAPCFFGTQRPRLLISFHWSKHGSPFPPQQHPWGFCCHVPFCWHAIWHHTLHPHPPLHENSWSLSLFLEVLVPLSVVEAAAFEESVFQPLLRMQTRHPYLVPDRSFQPHRPSRPWVVRDSDPLPLLALPSPLISMAKQVKGEETWQKPNGAKSERRKLLSAHVPAGGGSMVNCQAWC